MKNIVVKGQNKISGSIKIEGAKNAALPILAATILNKGKNIIHNCPMITDVIAAINILKFLGCKVSFEGNTVIIDSTNVDNFKIPDCLMCEMRSSVIFLGAVLSRTKQAVISHPGGCEIGERPIDLHLKALKKLGVEITEEYGYINCKTNTTKGCDIYLDFPSVGATENIMLASVFAKGTTIIRNGAKEPEIKDLQDFLNKMGARISGAGTDLIKIKGVEKLSPAEHTVIPDRITTATYLAAAAITKGEVELKGANHNHISSIISVLKEIGCKININNGIIILRSGTDIKSIDKITTHPYPGFPTDAQAIIMALLTVADGTSVMVEKIFENRFKHVPELIKMGANIKTEGRMSVIQGVKKLTGAKVKATDLRGGAALIIAALAAEGTTCIENIEHIYRGYEDIEYKLAALGADIRRTD